MVYLRVDSIICLEIHNKVRDSSHKRCNWDRKWECIENTLANAVKNGLRSANGCKVWPIKKEK